MPPGCSEPAVKVPVPPGPLSPHEVLAAHGSSQPAVKVPMPPGPSQPAMKVPAAQGGRVQQSFLCNNVISVEYNFSSTVFLLRRVECFMTGILENVFRNSNIYDHRPPSYTLATL